MGQRFIIIIAHIFIFCVNVLLGHKEDEDEDEWW